MERSDRARLPVWSATVATVWVHRLDGMQCPSCGTDINPGQKFCMECGTALRSDQRGSPTGQTQAMPVGASRRAQDDPTRPVVVPRPSYAPPTGRSEDTRPPAPPRRPPAQDATAELSPWQPRTAATTAPVTVVSTDPVPTRMADTGELPISRRPPTRGHPFRLRVMLPLAVVATAATALACFTPVLEITAIGADFPIGTWRINDLGTNNAVAGLLAAGTMVVGAIAWCFGRRWGAGLAGGAGAALAGWVALVIGVAELPVAQAERSLIPSVIDRPYGYWVLIGAGGAGLLVLLLSLAGSGRGTRSGLDPWIAALGAVAFLLAAGGPLIPEGTADWTGNFSSESLQVDLPTLFFVGRLVQLGLLALCGVVGFLLVRRWGLGLAIGSAVAASWLLLTAATDRTAAPIGPGYANPASPEAFDLQPHAVTVVGFAMVGFFAVVAVVMAILDGDR
jgi:hypothetical protein